MSSVSEYIQRLAPSIDAAALAAKRRASSVIADVHLLWTVYMGERNKLTFEAADVAERGESERLAFEQRLQYLAGESESTVWTGEEN